VTSTPYLTLHFSPFWYLLKLTTIRLVGWENSSGRAHYRQGEFVTSLFMCLVRLGEFSAADRVVTEIIARPNMYPVLNCLQSST
jgi:hypothetical protein